MPDTERQQVLAAQMREGTLVTLHWDSSESAYRANVDGPAMYLVSETELPLLKAAPSLLAACELALKAAEDGNVISMPEYETIANAIAQAKPSLAKGEK